MGAHSARHAGVEPVEREWCCSDRLLFVAPAHVAVLRLRRALWAIEQDVLCANGRRLRDVRERGGCHVSRETWPFSRC